MEIKTIIIDDEEPARNLIASFLKDFPEIKIISLCADGFEGVKQINELMPDLVFLDIQMPKLTGFEVVELIEHKPKIIFSTAFDQYAVKAFDANAVDYLLKPYSKERFKKAIEKVLAALENADVPADNKKINEIAEAQNETLHRIAIKSGTKIFVLPIEQIHYIEADGDYVKVHTKDNSYLKEKTMRYFENNLPQNEFIRIHRSYIINLNEIQRIEQFDKENHIVLLKSGANLKTSNAGYKALKAALSL